MATTTVLERGMLLRDLPVHTFDGHSVSVSDFRGRRNFVLVFPGLRGEESSLLNELRQSAAELQEEEAIVLIADAPDDARRHYGAASPEGSRIAALYVADRYGEIYFAAHNGPGDSLPPAAEILEWLRFINAQCPE
jgi:peroxiredoxin